MNTKLSVIGLWAEDIPTTAHFYRDVVGLKLIAHHGARPHFDLGNCYLVILRGHPIPASNADPERFPVIAFTVDDLDTAIARLNNQHVAIPWGIEQDAGSRWIMFHDPAGNLIELVQWAHEGQST